MRKTHSSVLFFCILSSLLLCGESKTLAPYLNTSSYFPGNTYDLGQLASTDIIKVNLTWFMFVDYGDVVSMFLYTKNNSSLTPVALDPTKIKRPTSKSLVY